jgi:diguanylate cyclase (GGDEF)-like protein/PAS domain S-box-containing protein
MITDVTLRKRALAELEWTRSRYGSILDNLYDAIFLCDTNHMILYVNGTCRALLGWTTEEMVGSYLYNYIHPDDQQAVHDNHELLSSGSGEQPHVICRVCREDGSWLWLDTYARAVRGAGGEVMEIIGIGREAQKQEAVPGQPTPKIEPLATPTQGLENPSSTDPLTGLRNRRAGEDLLTTRLTSWRASAFPMGCLLVDIDHFGAINATYGQAVGDEVLKRVAAVLDDSCRDDDFVARYGGDEFLVVLPGTNAAGTIILGEKLIRNVREVNWTDLGMTAPVTISVGATNVQHNSGITLPELMGTLHTQVEQAITGGRDRMVMNTRQIAKEK